MDFGHVVFAIFGFSTSILLCVPNIKRWHNQHITTEKLRMTNEALEQAEERAIRFQERHDKILNQICGYYLTNKELLDALEDARIDMIEALKFASDLRQLQWMIIRSFPYDSSICD